MQAPSNRHVLILSFVLAVIGTAGYVLFSYLTEPEPVPTEQPIEVVPEVPVKQNKVIGTSVQGRVIEAFMYGTGEEHLLFVGGIHGGYEWNSVLLSYQLIDYLEANPDIVPSNLTVTVIPSANPDGVFEVIGVDGRFTLADVPVNEGATGTGRFNANSVDLNRNYDCKWKPESTWRGQTVSAGTAAFSEPESRAVRDVVLAQNPKAVVFFHSQSNAVYASECLYGVLPETRVLMNTYATAAGYPAVDSFDAYEITGDAEGWLASINIPAITVELKTHETIEWEKNLAGVQALLKQYGRTVE